MTETAAGPSWWKGALDFLFPPPAACIWCGRPAGSPHHGGLCARCRRSVPWVRKPVCQRCGKPLRAEGLCSDCRERPVPFSMSRAPAVFDGIWRDMIHAFKFAGRAELAEAIAWPMARLALEAGYREQCHALVPIPLSPSRLERRGFNQAERLARHVARYTGVPVIAALVRRPTRAEGGPQSLKSVRQRRRSLRGAFGVWHPEMVRGLVVAVVDDVYTTGATLDEAARALLRAGAQEVRGLVAAVGLSDRDMQALRPRSERP